MKRSCDELLTLAIKRHLDATPSASEFVRRRASASSPPFSIRLHGALLAQKGQLVKGVFVRRRARSPGGPALFVLSPVAPSVIWTCDLCRSRGFDHYGENPHTDYFLNDIEIRIIKPDFSLIWERLRLLNH